MGVHQGCGRLCFRCLNSNISVDAAVQQAASDIGFSTLRKGHTAGAQVHPLLPPHSNPPPNCAREWHLRRALSRPCKLQPSQSRDRGQSSGW